MSQQLEVKTPILASLSTSYTEDQLKLQNSANNNTIETVAVINDKTN